MVSQTKEESSTLRF